MHGLLLNRLRKLLIGMLAKLRERKVARARLRGSVRRYDQPLEPVIAPEEWDVNR